MAAPNICSMANLGCGFAAIVAVISGRYEIAPWFIIIAMVFDAYDTVVYNYSHGV